MSLHQLSRTDARRIAVRAQLLDAVRPTDLLRVVRHLTMLQYDQTAAVAPSPHLVAWSRLGSSYSPEQLHRALRDGSLVELQLIIRHQDYLALCRAEMAQWPGDGELRDWQEYQRDWVQANEGCRRDILYRLELDGPMRSRDLPDTCEVPWRSSGWTNNRNVSRLLDFMEVRGEVAVATREGRDRLWDLAYRVYPDDPAPDLVESRRIRNELRLAALGIARARGPEYQVEAQDVDEAGEPAVVAGVRGQWRVDPALVGQPFTGRTALLSPLDRLVYDRKRMSEIFEFDYQLEMYKPAAKRRWGYWALPILHGDRLVGKVDAAADRERGVLQVHAIHEDVPFSRQVAADVRREVEDLADWLELDLSLPDSWAVTSRAASR
ncbi:DNA glycosylase AlkZ-like family protein [Angustibacter sp. McL0619]|uniref:DNA glycosylase AlkZ-like family protein n=1 Tax=Angustibacter sp. McL0619 TaxID=3415676 RepID=UPI003CF099D2